VERPLSAPVALNSAVKSRLKTIQDTLKKLKKQKGKNHPGGK